MSRVSALLIQVKILGHLVLSCGEGHLRGGRGEGLTLGSLTFVSTVRTVKYR